MIAFFVPIAGVFTEIARTEVVYNNPNPKFVRFFRALYVFDTQQPIRFMVYDCDSNKLDLQHHSLIGYFLTDVFYLFTRLDQELTFDLVHDDKPGFRGQIILHP